MKLYQMLGVFVLASLMLASCAQGAQPIATPGQIDGAGSAATSAPLPAAVQAARTGLAQQLGIQPEVVTVQGYEQAEWPDGCLGAGQLDEMCTEAIVPGYGGILVADEAQWEFRANSDGSVMRFIPGAALSARQVLAQQLQLDLDEVRITGFEKVEWPDACLGVAVQGMTCAQVLTPGYKVTLQANDKTYEFHTNETGATAMLAVAPQSEAGEQFLTWQGAGGVCQTAKIGPDSVAFGACGGALVESPFVNTARRDQLAGFIAQFAPFEAETPAGTVNFQGQGTQVATPAEERMLAEWAHLVFQEAAGGRGGAAWGLALTWHREGGIAGFCDDLAVYMTGEVTATSCKSGQSSANGGDRLTSDQLEKLYMWIDSLKPFEVDQKDAAVADAMSIQLNFSGAGLQEATEAEKADIQAFAAELYAQLARAAVPTAASP